MTDTFSGYLIYGKPFEVCADNNSLTYVMT